MVAAAFLDRCFCVSERGSSVGTEVRAGITTFVTMAYILVVNPTIMATAGLPFKAAAFATAATAVVGSGFVSVFANLPFGLAPGMGLNAYFAYGVCIARDITERWQETLPIMLAMLFVCIFDTAGVQFGAGLQAGLVDEQTGQLPGTRAAFLGASLATGLGGILGTSPVIILNETCAGIAEGGKTGLTGLVVALLFLLSLPFLPIFAAVPLTATAPCCIIVGAFMMGPAGAMDWDDLRFSLPAFLTITVMPMTYSIANGVVAGLVAHFILNVFSVSLIALFTGPPRRQVSNKLLSDPLFAEGQPIQPPKLSPHAPRVRLDDRVEAAERFIERAGSFNRSPSAGHWSPPGL